LDVLNLLCTHIALCINENETIKLSI
jgi:hypothetical protein